MSILIIRDITTTWCIRIVRQGDRYGNGSCLIHSNDEPLIEFYDTRFPHTDLGQFVGRYRRSTLEVRVVNNGAHLKLILDEGVPSWVVSKYAMMDITAWLKNQP